MLGLKIDYQTGRGRLKLFIVVSGFLLVLAALTAGGIAATSTPSFCASCHEMQGQYLAWQQSPHNGTSCVQCHVGPGVKSLVEHKLGALRQVYDHFTGDYPQPIKLEQPLPPANCQRCHAPKDEQKGNLVIPHDRHIAAGLACSSCHRGLAHDKPLPPMEEMKVCMDCHQTRGVANKCNTCHINLAAVGGK